MKTKKVKGMSEQELLKVFGGGPISDTCDANATNCPACSGTDATDCTSEAASGGTTTDTGGRG